MKTIFTARTLSSRLNALLASILVFSLLTVSAPLSVRADDVEVSSEPVVEEVTSSEEVVEEVVMEEIEETPVEEVEEEVTEDPFSEFLSILTSEEIVEEFPEEELPEEEVASCLIVSDTLTSAEEGPAVFVSDISSFWTALIADAFWIWSEDPTENQEVTTTQTFTRTFSLSELPEGAVFKVAVDDGYSATLNGNPIGADDGLEDVNFDLDGQDEYVLDSSDFLVGENVLVIEVTNVSWEPETANPGGLLFSLSIEGAECEEGEAAPVPTQDGGGGGPVKRTPKDATGDVLGASTCSPLLNEYLGGNYANTPAEVMKLQEFLNGEVAAALPLTGTFGPQTEAAVRTFQLKYWEDVLQPWFAFPEFGVQDANDSTGIVYKTTKWKINDIYCKDSEAEPTLP